jgi:hypothetical protein
MSLNNHLEDLDMNHIDRRTLLKAAAIAGASATVGFAGIPQTDDGYKAERERMVSLGFTEGEAECWEMAARAATAFFKLPELHPMDKQEVATAIHVLQNKLLGRPTYRKYLESAKAAAEKKG